MTKFRASFTKHAVADISLLSPKLQEKLQSIIGEICANPYEGKKLLGSLRGNYSWRLTYKDRIVYSIDEERGVVYIKRARTHYGE